MPPALFVVPDHGLGAIRSIPVHQVDTALLAAHLRTTTADAADLAVTIRPGAAEEGLRVFFKDDPIGTMAPADAREYPELGEILAAGQWPLVTARARQGAEGRGVADRRGTDGRGAGAEASAPGPIVLGLRLPAPGLLIPANRGPEGTWALLEPGAELAVEYLPGARRARAPQKLQYLATLGFDAAGEVAVCIDGEKVGYLDLDAGARLAPTLRSLERRGVVAVARAFHDPSGAEPTLTVTAGPVDCAHLPAVNPLQPLERAEPDGTPATTAQGAVPHTAATHTAAAQATAHPYATEPPPLASWEAGVGAKAGVDKQMPEPGARRRILAASLAAAMLAGLGVSALAGRSRPPEEATVAVESTARATSGAVEKEAEPELEAPAAPEARMVAVDVVPAEAPQP